MSTSKSDKDKKNFARMVGFFLLAMAILAFLVFFALMHRSSTIVTSPNPYAE